MSPRPILEIVLARDGRYVEANPAMLEAIGYSEDEIRGMPVGTLSAADPTAGQQVWRMYVAGELGIPGDRPAELRRKDGTTFPVVFLGLERDGDRWISRMRLVSRARRDQPRVLHFLLDEWRSAERRLGAMAPDDPELPAARIEVEQLRTLYQSEARRRDAEAG